MIELSKIWHDIIKWTLEEKKSPTPITLELMKIDHQYIQDRQRKGFLHVVHNSFINSLPQDVILATGLDRFKGGLYQLRGGGCHSYQSL